jgi:hypothetical protein
VYDPCPERTQQEAALLDCKAAGGVGELIDSKDIDALLLPGGVWFGLWPLVKAASKKLPVLCAISPVEDEAQIDGLRQGPDAQLRIHFALWPALNILLDLVADLSVESLGHAHFVQASWSRRRGTRSTSMLADSCSTSMLADSQSPGTCLSSPAVLALLRGLADLFGSAPVSVQGAVTAQQPGFTSLVLEFDGARVVQLNVWEGPAARTTAWLHVEAENGSAHVELPRLLSWSDVEGRHRYELPGGPAEVFVLERFVEAERSGAAPECDLARACEALDWLRAARQSLQEGRRVNVREKT